VGKEHYRRLSLTGIDVASYSLAQRRALARDILDTKIHGLSFSPYIEGQGPGIQLGDAQIRERLAIVAPHVSWIRTFSCTEGNERIPVIAAEFGLQTMVGVWLGEDRDKNEIELSAGCELASAGYADILAVGNEVLLRGDMGADDLIDYMTRAKMTVPQVEVGYVDAYFNFREYPQVTEVCDVVLANCYPFWEGCVAEHALLYMKEMFRIAARCANGKRVIISETGWPTAGTPTDGATPSYEHALKYFIDTYQWAEEDGIEVFYFAAFDEAWKTDKEGDVGAYWGLWDKDGKPKYA